MTEKTRTFRISISTLWTIEVPASAQIDPEALREALERRMAADSSRRIEEVYTHLILRENDVFSWPTRHTSTALVTDVTDDVGEVPEKEAAIAEERGH